MARGDTEGVRHIRHHLDKHFIFSYTVSHPHPDGHAAPHVSIDPGTMREAASTAVTTLKVLANEDRLLLLCQLSQGEMCVGDLEAALGIRQPTLSQQLGVLRNDGVVHTRREGKQIFYSVADQKTLQLLELLYALYCPKE